MWCGRTSTSSGAERSVRLDKGGALRGERCLVRFNGPRGPVDAVGVEGDQRQAATHQPPGPGIRIA